MAIKYKVIARVNPQKRDDPPKYYAQTVMNGKDDIYTIARSIAEGSTAGVGDILLVIIALGEKVTELLKIGRIVDLQGLGIFKPGMISHGADSPEEFNSHTHIKRIKINIQPAKALRDAVSQASLKKVTDR